MQLFELTRALIDIESITGNEERVGLQSVRLRLARWPRVTAAAPSASKSKPRRSNVFACWGDRPIVTLSTHMDTVPPFVPSREDANHIWGRGACDTKGIIASMLTAAEALLEAGVRNFGLLFVVGEERNSAGAYHAAQHPRGSRYLINGEPTENKLALGSKGALRYEIVATGGWRTPRIPSWANRPSTSCSMRWPGSARIPLPVDRSARPQHAEHRHHRAAAARPT